MDRTTDREIAEAVQAGADAIAAAVAADTASPQAEATAFVQHLSEAVSAGRPDLFVDHVAWAKAHGAASGRPASDLGANLEALRGALATCLAPAVADKAADIVDAGLRALPSLPDDAAPSLDPGAPLAPMASEYIEALLAGDRDRASRLITEAARSGTSIRDLYLHVFQASQREIGRRWQMNEVSIAQEHFCTAATQMIMSQLYPYLFAHEQNGRVLVATCVGGDLHEIGIRMVADFFEMDGWDTFYLGANTPSPEVAQMVRERRADVLAVSATMTFHVNRVQDLIDAVRHESGLERVRILVGGYPFQVDPSLWRTIGADSTAEDAGAAVAEANRLMQLRDGT